MENIIAQLYEKFTKLGVDVIDKMDDGFNHFVAVRNGKTTLVVYTTKGYHHMCREKKSCLKVFEVSEHLSFDSVKRDPMFQGNFVAPYTKELRASGKILSDYSQFFSVETLAQLLEQ